MGSEFNKDFKLNILFNEIGVNLVRIKDEFDDKFKDNYYSTDELIDVIEEFFTKYCFLSMNVYNFIGLIIDELRNEIKNKNSKDKNFESSFEEKNPLKDN